MEAIGKLVVGLIAAAISALVRGVALWCMWAWFVVPLGTRHLGIAQATGVSFLVAMLTFKKQDLESIAESASALTPCLTSILISLVSLGCGWVVHLFM